MKYLNRSICQKTVFVLFHDTVELRSKSFTFGITRASSVPLSLNQDFLAVVDVDALLGFMVEWTT